MGVVPTLAETMYWIRMMHPSKVRYQEYEYANAFL